MYRRMKERLCHQREKRLQKDQCVTDRVRLVLGKECSFSQLQLRGKVRGCRSEGGR
jgi:hypothetical protein